MAGAGQGRAGSDVLFLPPELRLSPHPLIITASNVQPCPWAHFTQVRGGTVQHSSQVRGKNSRQLQPTHLYNLLLHVDGVGDGGAVWLHLRVLPRLTTSCQGKDFLREIEF